MIATKKLICKLVKLIVHAGMQVDGIEPRLVEAAQKVHVGAVCGHGIGYFKLHYGERNHSGFAEDDTQVTSQRLMMAPPLKQHA